MGRITVVGKVGILDTSQQSSIRAASPQQSSLAVVVADMAVSVAGSTAAV